MSHSYLFGVGRRDASFPIIRSSVKVRKQILHGLLELCFIVITYNNNIFKVCQNCLLPCLISNKIKTQLSWLSFSPLVLSQDCLPNDFYTHFICSVESLSALELIVVITCWPFKQLLLDAAAHEVSTGPLEHFLPALTFQFYPLPLLHACDLSARLE